MLFLPLRLSRSLRAAGGRSPLHRENLSMNSIAASDTATLRACLSSRRVRLAGGLLAASVAYALAATALLPHRLALTDAADVFIAGAVPGLLVTLLLWMARPRTFDRRPRRILAGLSVSAAAAVALLSLIVPGL